ncbi:MAG TPA: AAA family ATPase [Candidatus Binataceae bacterium]|nr:AAA family ATPase [Candidatus Binataceae bacterium]
MLQTETLAILFTDLVSSTEHLQREGDEASDRLFRVHHRLLSAAIEATGGTELEWLGDGVLAAFSSAANAVRCAITMQQTACAPGAGARFEMKIGIHLGEVLRRDSGYFGTPIVITRRLCDAATGSQILCSRIIAELLSSRNSFEFRDRGEVKLKGFNNPISLCEVIYEHNDPIAMLTRTPFVGRATQLERLSKRLDEAFNGRGAVAMLRGEAGIGKTRTLQEFADHAAQRGAVVMRGACYDGEWQPPYGPFAEIIASYARDASPMEISQAIGKRAGILARIAPMLHERLEDIAEPVSLDKDEERFRLFDAVTQFFVSVSRRAPALVILDDLHWADRGTVALLNHVSRFTSDSSMFLIGAYRDGEVSRAHPLSAVLAGLGRSPNFETITLGGLQSEELASLLKMIGDQEAPAELVKALNEATEGNPLFFRELLLLLFEEGKILKNQSGWGGGLNIAELAIPEGVRQVIGQRLLRLSEDANRLLSVTSAFNGSFEIDVAASVAGLDEDATLNAIDEALNAQLLRPGSNPDTFDFTHALIRHTLYSEMNPARRTRLHRRIAEEMERTWSERTAAHAAELAYQFWRGATASRPSRGAEYAIAAADNAEAAYAHDDVGAFLRIALELIAPDDPRRASLLGRRAVALAWTLNNDEALQLAREAGQIVVSREAPRAAAEFYEQTARMILKAGCQLAAWEMATEGLKYIGETRDVVWASLIELDTFRREAADPDNPGIRIDSVENRELYTVLKRLPREQLATRNFEMPFQSREEVLQDSSLPARVLMMLAGDYRRCLPMQQREAADDEQRGAIATATRGWADVARCHIALGNFTEAEAALDRALKLAARMTTPNSVGLLNVVAARCEMLYALDEGWEHLMSNPAAQAFLQGPGAESKWAAAGINAYSSYVLARVGQSELALQRISLLPAALERGAPWDPTYSLTACVAAATLWILNSNTHAETVERNIRLKVLAPDFRSPLSDSRLSLARLCALQGRVEEASEWFAKARDVFDEQGARPFRAIADFDQSLMYFRAGNGPVPDQALTLLESAAEQFRLLGMSGWIRRAEQLKPT